GRLAHNLGSSRLGRIMHRVAFAKNPSDAETRYFYALSMSRRRGILGTWQLMQDLGEPKNCDNNVLADWYGLLAQTYGYLRDFQQADLYLNKAFQVTPESAWLYVTKSSVLEFQDRNEEALEAAQKAHELRPWYRPAVQVLSHQLVQSNRDDEALQLMRAANEKMQSGDLLCQQAAFHLERQEYPQAREIYDNVQQYYPLLKNDKKQREWFAARRADAAYYCGDHAAAASFAKETDSPFYKKLAERIEDDQFQGSRKVLDVHFVRQHHMTCAPATLAALSKYWDHPAEHLDVVEEICYDGTPAYSERRWANQQGFITREFRVTMESAKALIQRGVPFTLTTIDPGNGHLQGAIGYDTHRDSLILREPGERHFNEFAFEEVMPRYRSTGPRGMAFVPKERSDLLDDLTLPDEEFFDDMFAIELALEAHKREDAAQRIQKMRDADEDHFLNSLGGVLA
ncbi:MAG: C39 family peptidase, partial [Planctomycetota bacterium]